MDNYKKEITSLHERNLQSTVNAQTAELKASLNSASAEITELQATIAKIQLNFLPLIIAVLIGILIGILFLKIF